MSNKRIYVLVPYTVQVPLHPITDDERNAAIANGADPTSVVNPAEYTGTKNIVMEVGRMLMQCHHVGRKIERVFMASGAAYQEITSIALGVRNSKELAKLTRELHNIVDFGGLEENGVVCEEFHDTNPAFYDTYDSVHTVTSIGPVTREEVDEIIGHLELYA